MEVYDIEKDMDMPEAIMILQWYFRAGWKVI